MILGYQGVRAQVPAVPERSVGIRQSLRPAHELVHDIVSHITEADSFPDDSPSRIIQDTRTMKAGTRFSHHKLSINTCRGIHESLYHDRLSIPIGRPLPVVLQVVGHRSDALAKVVCTSRAEMRRPSSTWSEQHLVTTATRTDHSFYHRAGFGFYETGENATRLSGISADGALYQPDSRAGRNGAERRLAVGQRRPILVEKVGSGQTAPNSERRGKFRDIRRRVKREDLFEIAHQLADLGNEVAIEEGTRINHSMLICTRRRYANFHAREVNASDLADMA